MVCTFRPPGVSIATANNLRASARMRAEGCRPSALICASRPASSSAVHSDNVSKTRVAILAAAALVNVMQRIFSGAVPVSSRRITRSVRTCVLPDPALANTQAETAGSDGFLLRLDDGGRRRLAQTRSLEFSVVFTAERRPFLHARKVIVVAIGAADPLRAREGLIRRLREREFLDDLAQSRQRLVGFLIGRRIFKLLFVRFSRGSPPLSRR